MTSFNLYLDDYDWMVRVFLDADNSDTEEVVQTIREFGGTTEELKQVKRNMVRGARNNGICFPNYRDRMSVMMIGRTTSAMEFLDSLVHEIMHLAIHISTAKGIDLRSEEVCYIGGDVARAIYSQCREYLCCHCHGEN